ncbi:MAG: MBL fold metallo-hydrolase [Cyclobacteriaceae bacterium]|nr:MBL fold metallo-hydrolase [Cyclobacteriaceae bacterium]MCX7636826.1 MBL fold metallo-hydrolase [Cyclobacteriaceae bacterium]MDW8331283.1 MBL fold metallo-hydrolase [Cyclobacteriaceae bacterium]
MTITFLGTGTSQGVPVIGCDCEVCTSVDFRDKRLRSSVHIQNGSLSLVIDTGPDFRQQILRENIQRLDAVLFTHAHRDHTAGLDDVRAFNFKQNMHMPVYGSEATLNQLKQDFAYIFGPDNYPGLPRLQLHALTTRSFSVQHLEIIPLPVYHYKLPVLGFRIGSFAYITDANQIPEETMERIKGVRVLVLNALQREPHISHFNLDEAVLMAQRIGAQKTYFTHISHKLGLHRAVEKELPHNIGLAWDGLRIDL